MFYGDNLKILRNSLGYSLDDLAQKTEKSRQFIHSLENSLRQPNNDMITKISMFLGVHPDYFSFKVMGLVTEDAIHFRKLKSTSQAMRAKTVARAEFICRAISVLDDFLNLPAIDIPFYISEDIEEVAEYCRNKWGLGISPVSNMVRLAEKIGIIVLNLEDISKEIDASSIAAARPIILRNLSKPSPCRHRFDVAHEIGHLVLHQGIVTGDKKTETEANRFASAILLPRQAMYQFFPKPINNRIQWSKISEFKLYWKVSKAAIFYRARQLGLLNENQYKSAVITLQRKGEAISEKEDHLIEGESPYLLKNGLKALQDENLQLISSKLRLPNKLIASFLGIDLVSQSSAEIIQFPITDIKAKDFS